MKRTNKANGIRSAVPRLADYMRSSMGVIILALILAALSARDDDPWAEPDRPDRHADVGRSHRQHRSRGDRQSRYFPCCHLCAQCSFQLYPALHDVRRHAENVLLHARRAFRQDQPRPAEIFQHSTAQGDILSRITNDVSTLQQGLTNALPTIISAATQFIGCLIMMFVTEWRLALVSIGVTILGMLLTVLILSRSQRYFAAAAEKSRRAERVCGGNVLRA